MPKFIEELKYWDKELSLQGVYPEDIKDRITPNRMKNIFPKCLYPFIVENIDKKLLVLDVGSGPISMLNYGADKNFINLYAADPLTNEYRKLLDKYNYSIKYTTSCLSGEELSNGYNNGIFDIVWCHNALDHSQDPNKVFREMVMVTKPKGYILFLGWEYEGTYNGFFGLHQHDIFWNDELGQLQIKTYGKDVKNLIDSDLPICVDDINISSHNGRRWLQTIWKKN